MLIWWLSLSEKVIGVVCTIMRYLYFLATLCFYSFGSLLHSPLSFAQATGKSLEKRIEGFKEHHQEQNEFDKARDRQLKDYVKLKNERESDRQKAYEEYLKQRSQKKKVDPESTAAYEEYLLQKWQWKNNAEKTAAKENYIKNNGKSQFNAKTRKFELEEYALDLSEENRVPFNKRKLFTSSNSKSVGSSVGGFSGSDYSGGGAPYSPPPQSFDNDLPDFEDNNIPPPPPPPDFMPGGNESMPGGEPNPFIPPPPSPSFGP